MSTDSASIFDPLREFIKSNGNDYSFLNGIYDFFPGIIYVYDADKNKLCYVNKKITEVLGYSYEDLKTWDNDFSKVVFNEDLDSVQKELEKFNDLKNDNHDYKCRFNCKEGKWRHFHVLGKVLKRSESGKASSLLFIAQDVTDLTQSTEETKNIKDLMNETEELLRFGTWTWDIKTGEMKWSKGIYVLLGYDPEEFKEPLTETLYFSHIVEEDTLPVRVAVEKAVKNKEPLEKEYFITTLQGEDIKVYSKGKTIIDKTGEVVKILGITRCITAQTKLYESVLNYKHMAMEKEEFLGHGSWTIDYTTNVIQWSDGMFRLFGYDPQKDKDNLVINEQLYKSHMLDKDFSLIKTDSASQLGDGNSYMWEDDIITRDGEIKKLETFCKTIRDRRGNHVEVIGTTRDITKIRNYERELERKIAELKRSNKDLEDFAYIASHDIQEPLRKITAFSERLKTKYSNDLDEEAQKYLERIIASTKNARLLIDGLMEFSKVTATEGEPFMKVSLNTLFQEVKTELELKIEETSTIINVEQLPTLEVVSLQIKQLLLNLLLNAIKFKKADVTPVITIKSKKLTRFEIEKNNLNTSKSYYEIAISDNGIGFEEEYADRIFQMYQRLHSKADYPGAGIGLALCKKIVENHNGVIFASSKLNDGTTFSVILPEMQ